VKDLYNENPKILKTETEQDTGRWKDLSCSWTGRINIVKIAKVLKAINRFNAIPSKFQCHFTQK
jgi:hypothetical protein